MFAEKFNDAEGYDLIGDVHGHADELHQLLELLGYQTIDNGYHHPKRQVIFLGDFVDGGPRQIETLRTVKAMVENGHARSIMGNHEYNAICYATPDKENAGMFLRPHNKNNDEQHERFLEEVTFGSEPHKEWIDWFKTLPLYMDLGGLRVIHACWHRGAIDELSNWLDPQRRLSDEGFVTSTSTDSELHSAIEIVLKGIECPLPSGITFRDTLNHERCKARVCWWRDHGGNFQDAVMLPKSDASKLQNQQLPTKYNYCYTDEIPVFFGHYSLAGMPKITSKYAACVDFGVRKKGYLCAYRWSGESLLNQDNLFWVKTNT
jgi:hypothetical protein